MKLISLLEYKISQLENLRFKDDFEYYYFERMFQVITSKKDIPLTDCNILLALLALNNKTEDFEETFNYITQDLTFDFDAIETLNFITFLHSLAQLEELEVLDEILEFENNIDLKIIIKKKNINDIREKEEIINLISLYKKTGLLVFKKYEDVRKIASLVKGDCAGISRAFMKISAYRESYEHLETYRQLWKNFNLGNSPSYDLSEIDLFKTRVKEKYRELKKQFKKFTDEKQKTKEMYEKAKKLLEKVNDDQFTNIPDEIMEKLDDDLLVELIKHILDNDRKIYTNLQIENIKKNHYNEIESILLQNGINVSKFSEEAKTALYNNIKLENLEKIIPYINLEEFRWLKSHPNLVQILLNTEENIFKSLVFWVKNGIISMDAIYKNIGIFIKNIEYKVDNNDCIPCHNKVKNNITLLSKLIDLKNRTIKNSEILFVETSILKQLVELVKNYKLNLQAENAKNYTLSIFNDTDKFDDLDGFIELGFADYIINNAQLINETSREILLRLSIIINAGLNPYSTESRLHSNIITGKNFFVSNEELDEFKLSNIEDYIANPYYELLQNSTRISISKSTLELEIVRYLDVSYKTSELEYNFDGMIISRIKFLRNLECLSKKIEVINEDMILCCLTYKTPIDLELVEFIKTVIKEFKGKQYKKESK